MSAKSLSPLITPGEEYPKLCGAGFYFFRLGTQSILCMSTALDQDPGCHETTSKSLWSRRGEVNHTFLALGESLRYLLSAQLTFQPRYLQPFTRAHYTFGFFVSFSVCYLAVHACPFSTALDAKSIFLTIKRRASSTNPWDWDCQKLCSPG